MKFKTFVASIAITGTFIAPVFVFAQEAAPIIPVSFETVIIPPSPTIQMQSDLAELKIRESDPSTGFVARFFIRLKIREIENKLNIATALN